MAVREFGLVFLQVAAVRKKQAAKFPGRLRAVDRPSKTLLDQQRRKAAVVDVGMCKHDRLKTRGVDRQRQPVALPEPLVSPEQAAVDQHTLVVPPHQIFRSGDSARRPRELERRRLHLASRGW